MLPKRVRAMSLGRLIDEFDNPESPHDKKEIINRVGCLLDELTKEKEKAEAFFRRLLGSGSKGDKFFALGHLGRVRGLNEATRLAIKRFFRDPKNKVLAGEIEQVIDKEMARLTR